MTVLGLLLLPTKIPFGHVGLEQFDSGDNLLLLLRTSLFGLVMTLPWRGLDVVSV